METLLFLRGEITIVLTVTMGYIIQVVRRFSFYTSCVLSISNIITVPALIESHRAHSDIMSQITDGPFYSSPGDSKADGTLAPA